MALARPWVGICSYYLLAILGPQYIWWWNFDGLRPSLVAAVCTVLGILISATQGKYDCSVLLRREKLWMLMLWATIVVSYYCGPFVDMFQSTGLSPQSVFYFTNVAFVFYYFAVLEINTLNKVSFLFIIFVISTVYLVYWANSQYFSKNWAQFSMGRLRGPAAIDGGSIYGDENAFAMLFVTGLPFVYYWGSGLKLQWQKWLVWAWIPFGWHAVFLTGSRGGLVGLGVGVLATVLLSQRKIFALILIPCFVFFYQWQAGDIMGKRSKTIVEYEGEGSAEQRIAAWTGGLRMILDHPITGVGLGSFITALPYYHKTSPRVAHNTLIQFTAESGVGAGVAYVLIIFTFFRNARMIRRRYGVIENCDDERIWRYNDACVVSFSGLLVCSMFLSLNTYEIFFVLLIIGGALKRICDRECQLEEIESV